MSVDGSLRSPAARKPVRTGDPFDFVTVGSRVIDSLTVVPTDAINLTTHRTSLRFLHSSTDHSSTRAIVVADSRRRSTFDNLHVRFDLRTPGHSDDSFVRSTIPETETLLA